MFLAKKCLIQRVEEYHHRSGRERVSTPTSCLASHNLFEDRLWYMSKMLISLHHQRERERERERERVREQKESLPFCKENKEMTENPITQRLNEKQKRVHYIYEVEGLQNSFIFPELEKITRETLASHRTLISLAFFTIPFILFE
jgi:hypothetical protein